MPKIGDDGTLGYRVGQFGSWQGRGLPPAAIGFDELPQIELGPESRRALARLAAAVEAMALNRQSSLQNASSPVPTKALGWDEAVRYLGITPNKLDYLVRVRRIRYVKLGEQKGRVFRIEDLDQFLEGNLQMTAEEILRKKRPR